MSRCRTASAERRQLRAVGRAPKIASGGGGGSVELLCAPVLAPQEGASWSQGQPSGLLVAAAAALPGRSPLLCVALKSFEARAGAGAARAADSTTIGTRPLRWPCSQRAAASSPPPAHLPRVRELAAGHKASSGHQGR